MAVLTRQQTIAASPDRVYQVLTDLGQLPNRTQVSSVKPASWSRMATGTTWTNRGTTLKLPSWDTSRASEVTPNRVAWHTSSMVLRLILVGADWSYTLRPAQGGTEITHSFERVTMFGLPIGPLVKAPFLPMLYLARGAMMAGEKNLAQVLGAAAPSS